MTSEWLTLNLMWQLDRRQPNYEAGGPELTHLYSAPSLTWIGESFICASWLGLFKSTEMIRPAGSEGEVSSKLNTSIFMTDTCKSVL